MQYIYADNAATTKLDADAFEAMKPYLLEEYANPSQPYSFSRATKKALRQAREDIASCINALPEEIVFTSGGTESDNWAIKSMASKGDIITSVIEHHAVLNSCKAASRKITYLPVSKDGIVFPNDLGKLIGENTKLVSIMTVNNEIGTIEPISELATVAHTHGAFFHTDAVQAVGHIPLNVRSMNVDLLSASAHKFNGPRGIGFLYLHKGLELQSFMDGGLQENGMRAGTENVASIVGMAVALNKNCVEMKKTTGKLRRMEHMLWGTLQEKGLDCRWNGGGTERAPGIISLSFRQANGEMLLHRLDLMGICVSTGSACDSKNTQVSHVINAIGVPAEYAEGTIRISFGRDNKEEDALKVANAISRILKSG